MSEGRIRVFLADDHVVVRRGLAALLETEPDLVVIGEASDGCEAVARVLELRPDVVIMDLVMPCLPGAEAIRRIIAELPEARILVFTSFSSDASLVPAIRAGATGVLLKDADPARLIEAVRLTAGGQPCLAPEVTRRLLREVANEPPSAPLTEQLTDRESEVLRQLARGMTNRQIAERLGVSETTVRTHVASILHKLDVPNRTQAALYALRQGLASLDDLDLAAEQHTL